MSASAELRLEPDPRCLRGLRFTLALPDPGPDLARVRAALHAALPSAVLGHERWAERRVDRLIVQFRVELRLGERPRQLTVLFRSSCPAPERERLGAGILAAIAELYASELSRAG